MILGSQLLLREEMDGVTLGGSKSPPIDGNTHEIRFLVRIRGARTPPPTMDAPVMKIPLWCKSRTIEEEGRRG